MTLLPFFFCSEIVFIFFYADIKVAQSGFCLFSQTLWSGT